MRRRLSPGYVGQWAVRPDLCATGAFVLTESQLVTAGGVSCRWNEPTLEPGNWRLSARCTAEGPPGPAQLRLSLLDGGYRLRVAGASFEPVTLGRCPPA